MNQAAPVMSDVFTPARYKLTVEDYYKLGEVGILRDESRVELIEGDLIEMPPVNGPHMWSVNNLIPLFVSATGDRACVSVQNPIALPPWSVPEPDFALIRPAAREARRVPTAEDVMLLVEVADTTLVYDRSTKLKLYARFGIREYWVINVRAHAIECYRQPRGEAYLEKRVCGENDELGIEALPGVTIPVSKVFA